VHEFHAPILERLERLVRRGQRTGDFDHNLSAHWLATAFLGRVHSAADEVAAGRIDSEGARRALARTVPGVFGVSSLRSLGSRVGVARRVTGPGQARLRRMPTMRSTPVAIKLLAVPATAAIVLAGPWVTGAVITNDFVVAMWLTAAWMALAGGAALAVAIRSRALRWPVLGAYAVTAAVAGAYLGWSVVFDDVVDERVATAAPAPERATGTLPAAPRNVLLGRGRFEAVRHPAQGVASAIRLARGGRVLTLTGFDVDNGPDLRLYLVAGRASDEGDVRDYVDLGALKGNRGDQQYELPRGLDLERYSTVVVWCRAFSVLFARAPLRVTV
jgi:hypothetical protein